MPINTRTCALNNLPAYFFVRMRAHRIADAMATKESKQVNSKFSELKIRDIGMVTKVQRQDSIKNMHTVVKLSKPLN